MFFYFRFSGKEFLCFEPGKVTPNMFSIYPSLFLKLLKIIFHLFPELIHGKFELNQRVFAIGLVHGVSLSQTDSILRFENIIAIFHEVEEYIGLKDHIKRNISIIIVLPHFSIDFQAMRSYRT